MKGMQVPFKWLPFGKGAVHSTTCRVHSPKGDPTPCIAVGIAFVHGFPMTACLVGKQELEQAVADQERERVEAEVIA